MFLSSRFLYFPSPVHSSGWRRELTWKIIVDSRFDCQFILPADSSCAGCYAEKKLGRLQSDSAKENSSGCRTIDSVLAAFAPIFFSFPPPPTRPPKRHSKIQIIQFKNQPTDDVEFHIHTILEENEQSFSSSFFSARLELLSFLSYQKRNFSRGI